MASGSSAIWFLLGAMLPLARAEADLDSNVFTYFTRNGEDGLHLAWCRDGYKWEALNDGNSYLAPTVGKSRLIRDPCVVRGPAAVSAALRGAPPR